MNDLVIFGTGGFARETSQIVADINQEQATWNVVGFLDQDRQRWGKVVHDKPVLGDNQWLERHPHTTVAVAVAAPVPRYALVKELRRALNASFATLVHPLAWVSRGVEIGSGAILDAGALVSPDASIGAHVILNNACTVGHDTVLGAFCTVAPNASLSGNVHVGEGCNLGANCTVIQNISVGSWSIVGAGAVVIRDLAPSVTAVGVPAQPIKTNPRQG